MAAACSRADSPESAAPATAAPVTERKYLLERIDDAAVVQLYADQFAALPLREKTLVYHLTQAALAGRDIFFDQKHRNALEMRGILEAIVTHTAGIETAALADIQRYTKLFWINNGPYNNLTSRKFVMKITPQAFATAAQTAEKSGATFPTRQGESLDALLKRLEPMFFDPNVDPIVTNKNPGPGKDILTGSANNLYAGVSMADLKSFTEKNGLNSRLVKTNGRLVEEVYKIDGRYGKEIAQIVRHLEAAIPFASESTAAALKALVQWYRTGDDGDRAKYDIAWVTDKDAIVDTINGFVEVYMDARGVKGSWEGVVYHVNREKTQRIQKFADNAQWFEDHMPYDAKYRKPSVKGIVANAIDVVFETGDSGPVTPIGINLPNDQKIREEYGSKSVSLANVNEAYDKSQPESMRSEFAWTPEEAARAARFAAMAGELTTDMHEVIGHASGRQADGFKGTPQAAVKEHFSALEEARADLVGLYFIADPKLPEIGIFPAADQDAIVRAEYRGLHAQRAGAAPADSRGLGDRGRPHAQPADDRALADGQHQGDRVADARRQELSRDGRSQGVSRRRRHAPHRSAAHQVRRRLRGGEEALRDARHSLRPETPRRNREARRGAESPVLYRVRDAEADAGDRRVREDHRRHGVVSAGPDETDAGVPASAKCKVKSAK